MNEKPTLTECVQCHKFVDESGEHFMRGIYFEPLEYDTIYEMFKIKRSYCPDCINYKLKELSEYEKKIAKYSEDVREW